MKRMVFTYTTIAWNKNAYCSSNAHDLVLSQWNFTCVQINTTNNKQTHFYELFQNEKICKYFVWMQAASAIARLMCAHKTIFDVERLMNSFGWVDARSMEPHIRRPNGRIQTLFGPHHDSQLKAHLPFITFFFVCVCLMAKRLRRWHFYRQTSLR